MNDNEYEMNLWAITAMTVPINDDKKYLEYMYKEYSINYPPTLSFEINIKTQDKVDRDRVPVTLVCIKPKISTHDYFARCCEEWTRPSLEELTFIVDSLPEINRHKIEKVDWKKEGF